MLGRFVRTTFVGLGLFAFVASPTRGTSASTADNNGAMPSGRIVVAHDTVYGTTEYGGPNCRERKSNRETLGCGVVYRISGDGGYSVLHAFDGHAGERPTSGLVSGRDGLLYGATNAGGAHGHGAIYRLAPDGSGFAILYAFESGDRHGALTIASDRTIYGVAPSPDRDGHGATIFSLSARGTYRTLYSFGRESHVASPLVLDGMGRLRGIVVRAQECGGEVFWLTPAGAFGRVFSNAKPYTNPACASEKIPSSPLVESASTLYATDASSLYSVGADGLTVLFTLPKPQGLPYGPWTARTFVDGSLAVAPDGSLIGAITGYNRKRCGVVFQFSPVSGYAALHKFEPADGACFSQSANPTASATGFAYAADGALFGTAPAGADCSKHDARPAAPRSCQSLFRITAAGATILHVFEPLEPPTRDENKYPWGAWIGVQGERPTNRLVLSVSISPLTQAPFFVRTGTSALTLHPVDDLSRNIPLRFEQEVTAVAQPAPDSRGATGVVETAAQVLAPGMYAVDTSRFNPVITDADGYGISMNGLYPTMLYEPPQPTSPPQLRAGQQFVTFKQPQVNVHPTQLAGGLRILTLQTVEHGGDAAYRLTFTSDDSAAPTNIDTQSTEVNSVPGLTPIIDDVNVDRLNRDYQGRDVYVLGDFVPECSVAGAYETHVALDHTTPLHVRRIVRLYGASASWGIGPMASRETDSGSKYVAVDPLLVIFDGRKDGDVLSEPPFTGHGCVSSYAEFADAWDYERTFATTSPLLAHPEWPAGVRDAINGGTVLLGMTYDMVIASVGYPTVYGTAAQMRRLGTWEYVLPAPFSYTVKFKDGKVVSYKPPGRLP